jgi:hypothetical protein
LDRGRRPAALAVVLALCSLAASDAPPLAELRWLAPGADPVAALGFQPSECMVVPNDREAIWRIDVGEAAFRSPLVLGGQAARAGLSCDSCHRNGHGNPDFHFPGVSGAPGTADVTSSLFSSHRGNGVDDPRPIPDLTGPAGARKVSRDRDSRALETFIHGLITEEFDGPEPSPTVLAGLADYVRALGSDGACSPTTSAPRLPSGDLARANRAVVAARTALTRDDRATALTMTAAARSMLGRISERYAGLPVVQGALSRSAARLAAAEALIRAGDLGGAQRRLGVWLSIMPRLRQIVGRDARRSLYDPERLAADARLPRQGR